VLGGRRISGIVGFERGEQSHPYRRGTMSPEGMAQEKSGFVRALRDALSAISFEEPMQSESRAQVHSQPFIALAREQ